MIKKLRQSFLRPEKEYTPIPFWFWNDTLTEEEIIRQIRDFDEKGVNGFVIHPRIGIPKEIEYLSDSFMELVLCAVKEAQKLDMKVVLYDEAMYPSGSAHGRVVENNPEYASKGLKIVEYPCNGEFEQPLDISEGEKVISVQAVRKISETEIDPESIQKLEWKDDHLRFSANQGENLSVLVFIETFTEGTIRGIHFGEDDQEPDAPPSGDLLNRQAVDEFISLTHDKYYEALKDYFETTIIGIFTDEPCIMGRGDMTGLVPWTNEFLEYYKQEGNNELDLPFLWFNAGDLSVIKKEKYQTAVNKKLEENYYKPIYEWCSKHGIALTGHPEASDDIGVLKYFHIPAQDIVWRWVAPEDGLAIEGQHSTMAKCTSDSARHRGIRRNGNECFGCCGKDNIEWSFTADDMKWYMDWLFVRGVNLLFPHAFFYSVDGPRRIGERPPDVGPNNIWWPYYNEISDYIKRMSFMMTDSTNQAQVGVLCSGHHLPWETVKPLYENQIEFNYLENELLVTDACQVSGNAIQIAKQSYTVLLIEDENLISEENYKKLQEFVDGGGCVIIYKPSKKEPFVKGFKTLKNPNDVVDYIDQVIVRDFKLAKQVKDLRVSHILKDHAHFYVLVNEGEETIETSVTLNTVGEIEKWDAFSGTIEKHNVIKRVEKDSMDISLKMLPRESLIFFVNPQKEIQVKDEDHTEIVKQVIDINEKWYMGETADEFKLVDQLVSWSEMSNVQEHYSGTILYKVEFEIKEELGDKKFQLDLGEVHEIAKVTLNKKDVYVRMWAPYRFEITDFILKGKNELIVEVTNTLANRISQLNLKSGLIGPVRLNIYSS